jgi:hypothetical protein
LVDLTQRTARRRYPARRRRQYSHKTDLIAIATGRAANAATGFIIDNSDLWKGLSPGRLRGRIDAESGRGWVEELRSAN